ncbi:hypothetical protein BN1058_02835 [Paraliobacillus sp. PM-2]|uniref:hypothetical protein n=1 Tax=Paraliobacillus sp. PM-2 TaxID=1462524 RepID=UPI00061BDFC7|nr:hypothetical protein [Paraliobacillus sp. PM-2]CQR48465.1 hypothetical protein BN1058_02835 [Paraliobacillus sp. PM-2]
MFGLLPDGIIFVLLYGFLLIGLFITIKTYQLWGEDHISKKDIVILLILFLYNMLNFIIIFSILTVPPTEASGNGNPHIPYIGLSMILFLAFSILIANQGYTKLKYKSMSIKYLSLFFTLIVILISSYLQLNFVDSIERKLNYSMNNWLEWWKDIHLNSLYFNIFTFVLIISSFLFISILFSLFKKNRIGRPMLK